MPPSIDDRTDQPPGQRSLTNRPMRILWLSKVPPQSHTPRVWQIARRLAARGHEVRILTCRISAGDPHRAVVDGVEIEYLRTAPDTLLRRPLVGFYASRLPWYVAAAPALRHVARRSDVDVVIEDLAPVGGMFVGTACHGSGIPLVLDAHYLLGRTSGWLRMYGPIGLWGSVYDHLLTAGRIRPAALISDSRPLLDRLGQQRPDLAMHWIPNGFEPGGNGPGTVRDGGPVRILAVGRLAPPKGHRVLIDAMAAVRHRSDLELTIVGDGPLRAAVTAQIAAAGLDERVKLTGRVPYDELYRAYETADLFVMPSLAEGLPIALVEALGMGLAIVASDIPEHRQVADGDVVTFVPVGDVAALADTIDRLASDTQARRLMGERGRALAETQYRWDVITDSFEAVLRDAAAGQ